jgi:fibronectin type 3 domain-containing protein
MRQDRRCAIRNVGVGSQILSWVRPSVQSENELSPMTVGSPMHKFLVVVCMIGSASACVNLDKPEAVKECASKGNCVNGPILDGGDDRPADRLDVRLGADGVDLMAEAGQLALDGPQATQDMSGSSLDAGVLYDGRAYDAFVPDAPVQPIVDGSSPEAPVVSLDGAVDVGITETCSVAGKPAAAGTVCRVAVDLCDVDEICNGVSTECPADKLAMAGSACRPAAGDCDIAETCDGTSVVCPADGFLQLGTVCRPAVDLCDVAESCTGTSAACPIDSVASATMVCRASTDSDKCDPAETCTGSNVSCPMNISYAKPGTPSNVLAKAGVLQATISWNAVSGATGYNVKRSTTSGTGYITLASSSTSNASPYVDTGLAGNTTYYYVVSAINTIATCQSENDSLETSVTTLGVCAPPDAPTITATPSEGIVTLSWAAVTGAVSYSVERSLTTKTGYVTIATVTTGTTFTDSNVTIGTTYYYVVTASNGTCSSGNSNEASTSPTCTPRAMPTGLTATVVNGSIILTWTASIGASSDSIYTVYRSTSSAGTYIAISTDLTDATYTDPASGLTNGTAYYYKVSVSNANHQCTSAQSGATLAVRSCTIPVAPMGLSARRSGNKQVTLAWTNSTGAALYNVLRSATSGSGYTSIGTTSGTPYVDNTAANATAYYYVVTASSDTGGYCTSANSTQVPAPACEEWASGKHSEQLTNNTAEWCVVTCADISSGNGYAEAFSCGNRSFYFNGTAKACNAPINAPAKANGGYVFYFSAGSVASTDGYVGAQVGNYGSASGTCP